MARSNIATATQHTETCRTQRDAAVVAAASLTSTDFTHLEAAVKELRLEARVASADADEAYAVAGRLHLRAAARAGLLEESVPEGDARKPVESEETASTTAEAVLAMAEELGKGGVRVWAQHARDSAVLCLALRVQVLQRMTALGHTGIVDDSPSVAAALEDTEASLRHVLHRLETAPQFSRQWTSAGWRVGKTRYLQRVCSGTGCTARIRTYCRCNPAECLCTACYVVHLATAAIPSPQALAQTVLADPTAAAADITFALRLPADDPTLREEHGPPPAKRPHSQLDN